MRFIKHPTGMIFWRISVHSTPKHTFALFIMSMMFIGWLQWHRITESKQETLKFIVRSGVNMKGDGTTRFGLYDTQSLIPVTFYHQLAYSYADAKSIYPSNSNGQAYRKHFDLRRAYGLNQSI